MTNKLGEEYVREMVQRDKEKKNIHIENNEEEDIETSDSKKKVSRFIIGENNYWNMQWNNCTQITFVLYIILAPILIV